MKKFVLICAIFALTIAGGLSCKPAYAEEGQEYYAKIQSTNAQFCASPNENSAIFNLPYSYFVKVEYSVDDYYKVVYKDLNGYVKKDKVALMSGTPTKPFATATFKLFVPYSMYQNADNSSNVIFQTSNTEQLFDYYGTKTGQQVMSSNNTWYYCSVDADQQKMFGYIFSGVTDYLSTISTNSETFDIVSDKVLENSTTEFNTLSTGTKVILIVAISVPSVLILYFLIKPAKIMQITKTKKSPKKRSPKTQHGDYFEFDESQL